MTKSDQIRQHPDKPPSVVARIVGCTPQYVRGMRWRDENADRHRPNRRRQQHAMCVRHGVQPGAQRSRMTPALAAEVIRLRSGGTTQLQVAKSLGLTIGQVASVMYRYRRRLEKGVTGGDAR